MKLANKHTLREREVRQLKKRLDELYRIKRNLGWEELKQPYPRGWYKYWVLREDVLRHPNVGVFQEVLDATAVKVWSRIHKQMDQIWSDSKKDAELIKPGLKKLNEAQHSQLSSAAQKFFEKRLHYQSTWGSTYRWHCQLPEYYLVAKVRQAMVTHVLRIDAELESEMAETYQRLESADLRSIYFQWGSYLDWWQDGRHRRRRQKSRASLRQIARIPSILDNDNRLDEWINQR